MENVLYIFLLIFLIIFICLMCIFFIGLCVAAIKDIYFTIKDKGDSKK